MKLALVLVVAIAACWRGAESSEPSQPLTHREPTQPSPAPWAPLIAPAVPPPPAGTPPNPTCDAHFQQAQHFVSVGQHANAFVSFDAAIACDPHPYYLQMAFMTSCAAANSSKAKQYYKQLTAAQQTKFAQICIRQRPPVAFQ